ncbi:MAG: bifunctional adenosylcobinamide kinase/adenosylcobinamide-phosphate guanylyltransferase [Lachnospiraceae bacterium]|nr:bifunctional adenosylcobinamide kinase/adenosylcobinamide-phosphate guanylyltransferase [Lachnospiraceae bacterium]
MMILVLGGSGCGKSAYAESRIQELASRAGGRLYYLATMQVYGKEGIRKVERHKMLRQGKGMHTVEQTRNVSDVIRQINCEGAFVLLEDLGNLTANELFPAEEEQSTAAEAGNEGNAGNNWNMTDREWRTAQKIWAQLRELDDAVSGLVIVSNNVFEDGIRYEDGTRGYQRVLGYLHGRIAESALETVEMTAGLPTVIKRKA